MQPIFDAAGKPLYLYCIADYEECTWVASHKKYTPIELHEALIQELSKTFPIIDALNLESLELFGKEWAPKDDPWSYVDHENLEKGTVEQYDEFYDKWHDMLPFDPLQAALTSLGCERLVSEAGARCSHSCSTAYDCANHLRGSLADFKSREEV